MLTSDLKASPSHQNCPVVLTEWKFNHRAVSQSEKEPEKALPFPCQSQDRTVKVWRLSTSQVMDGLCLGVNLQGVHCRSSLYISSHCAVTMGPTVNALKPGLILSHPSSLTLTSNQLSWLPLCIFLFFCSFLPCARWPSSCCHPLLCGFLSWHNQTATTITHFKSSLCCSQTAQGADANLFHK